MKFLSFILSVISIIVIFITSSRMSIPEIKEAQFCVTGSISKVRYSSSYTYERVFKDGRWWIYVYDGLILVDVYEE